MINTNLTVPQSETSKHPQELIYLYIFESNSYFYSRLADISLNDPILYDYNSLALSGDRYTVHSGIASAFDASEITGRQTIETKFVNSILSSLDSPAVCAALEQVDISTRVVNRS